MKKRNPKLEVHKTTRYGKGVFARSDIQRGKIVHEMGGERIPLSEVVRRINSGGENLDDIFQIGKKTYMDLDEFSRTFNHSCDPSAGLRNTGEMFALRDIKKGEEITYDYSLTISPTEWSMKCKCGSKRCRKNLGDIRSVPKSQLDGYKKAGALQAYMKPLLKEIEAGTYEMPEYEKLALKELEGGASTSKKA